MFPAWAYYFGWQGWHALPQIEVLDVNAALDLSVGVRLDDLLAGKRGLWLVRWQNETTDPFDVLPLLLGTVGTQDDYGQFWHMELRHYRLPPGAGFDLSSFITRPVQALFGDQVRLLGVQFAAPSDLAFAEQSGDHKSAVSDGENGGIVLVWQTVAPVSVDYAVFVHLLDSTGNVLASADHMPARPTHEWPVGRILPDRAGLAPPGQTAGRGVLAGNRDSTTPASRACLASGR